MKKYKDKSMEKHQMSDNQKKAKMNVLQELKKQASDAMSDKLKGLKKVSVMANDEEGLEEGLEKAKEMVEANPQSISDENAEELDDCLSPEDRQLSSDEIEEKIQALQMLKNQKQS